MSVIVVFIAKTIVPIVGLMAAEHFVLRDKLPQIYAASSAFPALELPKAYGAVMIVNLIFSGFLLIYMGTKVGGARTVFKEKALKDGDKDAEDRYSYPKMYAEGFSKEAKLFNCVQRGHQHALETYTQFVALSALGGLKFPVTTVLGGLLWFVARVQWAEGYKTGEPSKRYQSWLAYGIWTSIITVMAAALGTTAAIML
jgi:glutathione S-transferase